MHTYHLVISTVSINSRYVPYILHGGDGCVLIEVKRIGGAIKNWRIVVDINELNGEGIIRGEVGVRNNDCVVKGSTERERKTE